MTDQAQGQEQGQELVTVAKGHFILKVQSLAEYLNQVIAGDVEYEQAIAMLEEVNEHARSIMAGLEASTQTAMAQRDEWIDKFKRLEDALEHGRLDEDERVMSLWEAAQESFMEGVYHGVYDDIIPTRPIDEEVWENGAYTIQRIVQDWSTQGHEAARLVARCFMEDEWSEDAEKLLINNPKVRELVALLHSEAALMTSEKAD